MLKNKIYKYFTIEIIKTFFTILFALSAIAWTVRAVSFLDLVIEDRLAFAFARRHKRVRCRSIEILAFTTEFGGLTPSSFIRPTGELGFCLYIASIPR